MLSTASSLLLMVTNIGMLDRWFDHVDASPHAQLVGRVEPHDCNAVAGDENEEGR